MKWILIVLLALLLFGVIPFIILAHVLYSVLLVRTKPEKWNREISIPDDEEYQRMYDEGLEWGERWKGCMSEVEVKSDGLRLAAQYFDFGGDKAVIIIPGRMESCLYSYYFAEPYRLSGYNVLCIDNRAHGNSEGRKSSLGYKEYRDILAWGRFLHEERGVREVFLHGICIGASTALFALTSKDCPEYFSGMVSDGMYVTFCESFKNHMIEQKRPMFPIFPLTMAWIRISSGANVVTDGPLYRIDKLKKPILMIQSKEDIYSLPEKAKDLLERCGSETKQLIYFDHGAHSRVRCNAKARYDKVIQDFLKQIQ